jgi:FKBP-type peptidyl-prolyl cis-trans isomerase FklB
MRHTILTTAAVLALAGFTTAQDEPVKKDTPATDKSAAPAPEATPENVSYAYGTMIGQQLKQMGLKVNADEVAKGISDATSGAKPRLTQAECQQIVMAYQQKKMQEDDAKASAGAGKNKEEGAAFLATNGKREGVTTTASGLQYEVLKKGDGAKPTATDTVKVHYHGTLLDGKVFDSSVDRGEPISFPLNGVIKGWTEGVQLMPTGSKFKFFIPSDLAYGDRGAGGDIGPGATLIFEVELLAIEAK